MRSIASIRHYADPFFFEVPAKQVGELRVLECRERRPALNDRHLGTEATIDLCELERDRARAEADEVLRQLSCVEQIVARREGHAVEAGDLRDARPRTGRDQRVTKFDLRVLHFEAVLVDEACSAAKERDALVAFDLMLVERDAVVDHALDARHHRGKVDRHLAEPDPELVCGATLCCDLRGPDQGFRGDAPPRDSGAADEAALE